MSIVPQALLYTAITIPCFFAGTVIELKALRCLEAGLYTITSCIMGLLGLIIFAYLLLGETLQGWEWLGLVCLSAGIFFTHSIARKQPA